MRIGSRRSCDMVYANWRSSSLWDSCSVCSRAVKASTAARSSWISSSTFDTVLPAALWLCELMCRDFISVSYVSNDPCYPAPANLRNQADVRSNAQHGSPDPGLDFGGLGGIDAAAPRRAQSERSGIRLGLPVRSLEHTGDTSGGGIGLGCPAVFGYPPRLIFRAGATLQLMAIPLNSRLRCS